MTILSKNQKDLIIRILEQKLEDRKSIESFQERTKAEKEETKELERSIIHLKTLL